MEMKEASMEVFRPEQRGTIIQLVKEENDFNLFICKNGILLNLDFAQ